PGVLRHGPHGSRVGGDASRAPYDPAAAEQIPAPAVLRHRSRQREGAALPARRGRSRPRGARQRLAIRALAPFAGQLGPGLEEPDPGREGPDPLAQSRVAAEAVDAKGW